MKTTTWGWATATIGGVTVPVTDLSYDDRELDAELAPPVPYTYEATFEVTLSKRASRKFWRFLGWVDVPLRRTKREKRHRRLTRAAERRAVERGHRVLCRTRSHGPGVKVEAFQEYGGALDGRVAVVATWTEDVCNWRSTVSRDLGMWRSR